ncbi:hypothetical protein M9Y38_24980, partial [Escherichia coli]|nr:hypothetical protein [Escherichia coli]
TLRSDMSLHVWLESKVAHLVRYREITIIQCVEIMMPTQGYKSIWGTSLRLHLIYVISNKNVGS